MARLPQERRKGQRLRSTDWNDSVNAIRRNDDALQRISPTLQSMMKRTTPGIVVKVHNTTGVDLAPRQIGGIDAHTFPDDPANIAITIVEPEAGVHDGKFVVTLEEIPDDTIGRAVLVGAALCTIALNDENHQFARIADGDVEKLESSPAGMARILWREDPVGSGVDDVSALVEFPLAGPPTVWEATADESGGEITAKQIDSTGAVTGEELTFLVLPDGS